MAVDLAPLQRILPLELHQLGVTIMVPERLTLK